MEYTQMTLNEWVEIKQKLRQELVGVKRSFVRIGYMLRRIDDRKGYEQDGYKSIAEFAQKELGLHPSTTTRFMEINREYSIDGYSERLREEYEDLSRSQLEEMLKLPEEDRSMIEPAASRESIRDLKRFNAAQPEDQMVTNCDQSNNTGQQEDKIRDLIESFFQDNPKELNGLFEMAEPADVTQEYLHEAVEIVNPSGNRSYRKGIFFVMMYENKIMIKQFGSMPQELSWEEFLRRTWDIFGEAATGAETWNNYFGHGETEEAVTKEEAPEATETSGEPVDTEWEPKGGETDDREDRTEHGEAETPDKDTQTDIPSDGERGLKLRNGRDSGTGAAEKELKPENEIKAEIAPAQKSASEPVNTECGADSGMPQNAQKPDVNQPEVVEREKTRREYIEGLTDEGLSDEIVKRITELREARRLDEILQQESWKKWLEESVDYLGRTIEEEAAQ